MRMHHVGHPKIQGLTCSTPRPSILQSATASSKRSVGREVQRQMPGGYLHRKMVKGLLQSPQKQTSLVCRICLSALDKVQIGTLKPYQNSPVLIFQINIHILHLGIRPPQKSNITDVFRQEYLSTGKLQGVRRLRKEWAQGHNINKYWKLKTRVTRVYPKEAHAWISETFQIFKYLLELPTFYFCSTISGLWISEDL